MNAVLDTNTLIDGIDISKYETVFIPILCIEELDSLKTNRDKDLSFSAKQAIKRLKIAKNVTIVFRTAATVPLDMSIVDNQIIAYAKDICTGNPDTKLVSADHNVILKANHVGVPCEYFESEKDLKDQDCGYVEVHFANEQECSDFYSNPQNKYGLKLNQYAVFYDCKGTIIDKQKWTQKGFKPISYRTIDNRFVGKVKPRNVQQELYMDMLQDKETRCNVCIGPYGTGKDYLALSTFIDAVDKGKFAKIIWVRNNIEADGTAPLGFLPGTLTEKLSPFADIITDFVGDKVGFENLIREGKLELVHTGLIRGRTFTDSVIYCTEAQNLTKGLVKLILSRVGEGSVIFFNGDIKQADKQIFRSNNGLQHLITRLAGNKNFAHVKLKKCERDEIAELAELLD